MKPVSWMPMLRILVLALGLLAVCTGAADAQTAAPPPVQQPPGLSASQAHDLVTLLSDPARRNQLIGELQTLEKIAPAAPVAEPARPAAPVPATVAARAVTRSGLLSQLALAAPAWAAGLLSQFASLRHVLNGIPASWNWLTQTATDEASRQYLMRVMFGLAVTVAPAALAWAVLRWFLRPRRVRLGELASREEPGGTQPPLGHRLSGMARRLSLALVAFLLDLVPIAAFTAISYLLTPFLTDAGTSQVVVLEVVEAVALFVTVLCIARAVLAPAIPKLRLLPMQDATAVAAMRWIAWLEGIVVFGMAVLNVALLLGLDPAAKIALQKLVLLVDHVLLVVIVVRNRRAVAAHLRSPKRRRGMFPSVLSSLAEIWHIVAVFLIMGMWLIWAADWQGGVSRLLEFAATAVAVGIVTRLVGEGLMIALRHALGITEPDGSADPLSAFAIAGRPRAARYYPVLRAGISGIMAILAIVVLLELSGFSSIGWLLGSTLGWQMFSAFVSILITLGVAVMAWEVINVAFERHLDRLSRQAQLARATRIRTLLPMLRTALAVTILILVALTTLSQIGVNIAPLLAGAGIVGVAIGFGSQKLVQDLITGLFLLLEDAMQVGDFVNLAGVSGVVENLSIRTIRLRAGDGSLHIIPFSSVTMVNNTNRGLGNAAISVTVAAREDPDQVGEVMKTIVEEMREDAKFKPMMLSDLQLWGVDKVDGSSLTLVGQIVCTDSGRWGVQREFNRRYRKRFAELGIEIPTATQTVLLRQAGSTQPQASPGTDHGETTATVTASPPSSSLGHTE